MGLYRCFLFNTEETPRKIWQADRKNFVIYKSFSERENLQLAFTL